MNKFNNIIFRNVSEFTDDTDYWKGFQIKAFAAYHTDFKEFILLDADVVFYQNPMIIYSDKRYKKYGAYFFRDRKLVWNRKFIFSNKEQTDYYISRQRWIRKILPIPPAFFPKDWKYIYKDVIPSGDLLKDYQEAGVVYYNREKHTESLKIMFEMNKNYKETYDVVYGDKETWWLACCVANQPFVMNNYVPWTSPLVHYYKHKVFFVQKDAEFKDTFKWRIQNVINELNSRRKKILNRYFHK